MSCLAKPSGNPTFAERLRQEIRVGGASALADTASRIAPTLFV
jgi:hypothetical protein